MHHISHKKRRVKRLVLFVLIVAILGTGVLFVVFRTPRNLARAILKRRPNQTISQWFTEPASRAELATSFDAPCPGYPFLAPSSGLIGGLPYNAAYGPYSILNPHPGIDIFGNGASGTVPVYAAYDGLLTREDDWISAVIIRHDDPLSPGRTIWTYYTHMANLNGDTSYIAAQFPPGARDIPVKRGDLIGYQGEYNGGPGAGRIGLHVHFSIVHSDDEGAYLNEAQYRNTLDPSPYLGLALNDTTTEQFPLDCMPAAEVR